MVPSGSEKIEFALKEITIKIYRTKPKTPVVASPYEYEKERKVTLKPSESRILEMSANSPIGVSSKVIDQAPHT